MARCILILCLLWCGLVNASLPPQRAYDYRNGAHFRHELAVYNAGSIPSGSMAKSNPFRFSTKYQDDESDWVVNPFRVSSASMGQWINRDPIGEAGGLNLYGFVGNNPVKYVDPYGLTWA